MTRRICAGEYSKFFEKGFRWSIFVSALLASPRLDLKSVPARCRAKHWLRGARPSHTGTRRRQALRQHSECPGRRPARESLWNTAHSTPLCLKKRLAQGGPTKVLQQVDGWNVRAQPRLKSTVGLTLSTPCTYQCMKYAHRRAVWEKVRCVALSNQLDTKSAFGLNRAGLVTLLTASRAKF